MQKTTETSPWIGFGNEINYSFNCFANPQLNEEDLFNIDPVQMASKITFIADDTIQVVSNLHWSEL